MQGLETISERAERLRREHERRNAPAMRAAFWAAKEYEGRRLATLEAR